MNRVILSPEYFPSPTKGIPVSLGDIYVGIPDTDPTVGGNQKQISVQEENGDITPVAQPVSTGAGGVPLYNGSPVTILVEGDYSLTVLDSLGAQVYYVPSQSNLYTGEDATSLIYNEGSTGAVDRTIENRLQERVSVLDFGATGDGVTDDYDAILAAINSLPDSGGIIYFPVGEYRVDTNIAINKHNVFFEGAGQGGDQNGVPTIRATARTRIFRGGSATTSLITFESVGDPKVGGGIEKIMLDGSNLALVVLEVLSYRQCKFSDLYVYAATGSNISVGATSGTLNFAPYDSQHNHFNSVVVSNRNLGGTAKAMTLSGGQGEGGTVGGNSSFNTFYNCNFSSNNPTNDVVLEDTDNNYFFGCRMDQLRLSSGEGDSSGNDAPARYNQFHGCEILEAVCAAGTTGGASSFSNIFIGHSDSNGAVLPIVLAGAGGSDDATASWFTSNGELQLETGINFGADTLDTYTEGAFTPVLAFGGASVGIVYTNQVGRYTQVGNRVMAQLVVTLSSKGSSVGVATITGLPVASTGGGGTLTTCAVRYASMTGLAGAPQAYLPQVSSTINLEECPATGATAISDTEFTATSQVMIQIVYEV